MVHSETYKQTAEKATMDLNIPSLNRTRIAAKRCWSAKYITDELCNIYDCCLAEYNVNDCSIILLGSDYQKKSGAEGNTSHSIKSQNDGEQHDPENSEESATN